MARFKGGKAATSPGTKIQSGSGIRPKLGRNLGSVSPRVGKSVISRSDESGGGYGRVKVTSAPKGLSPKGIINR